MWPFSFSATGAQTFLAGFLQSQSIAKIGNVIPIEKFSTTNSGSLRATFIVSLASKSCV
jgi:hypothetical protein